MATENQNFTVYRGEEAPLDFQVEGEAAGEPFDLSGAQAVKWVLGASLDGPFPIVKNLGAGVTVTDALAGRFRVILTKADTASLDPSPPFYRHEARVTDESGSPRVVARGGVTVRQSMTQLAG